MHPSKDRLIRVLVDAMKAVATTRAPWRRSGERKLARPTERDFALAETELKITFPEDYRLFIASAFDALNSYNFGFLFPGAHDENIVAFNRNYFRDNDAATQQRVAFWDGCDTIRSFDSSRRSSTGDYPVVDDNGMDVAKNFCNAAHDIVRGFVTSTRESLQERLEVISDAQARLLEYDVVVRK